MLLNSKNILSVVAAMALALLASCGNNFDDVPTRLVVEGYIDSDGYPRVYLTMSVSPSDHAKPLSDSFIRWGKVTVSDGDTTIILTGAADYDVFPPFVYRTYEMKGVPGKRYTVTAQYKELTVTSSATMLQPTAIDGIEFSPIEHNDSLCATFINFTSSADVPAYYVIQSRSRTRGTSFQTSMLGAFVANEPLSKYRMQVYRAGSDLDELLAGGEKPEKLSSSFVRGERISVKLCRVPKEIYDFWVAFDNNSTFGETRFVNGYTLLPSNIEGGYGVWSVQGACTIDATVDCE